MNSVESFILGYKDLKVPFDLVRSSEDAKDLMIVLPGAGYTVQAPFLYYPVRMAFNMHADVLKVNYQYNDQAYDHFDSEELSEAIKFDVNTVIDRVLAEKEYVNYYFVSKSLGTIALSSVLNREEFKDAKVVWLTPLLKRDDVYETLLNNEQLGLCIIGDKDRVYVEERFHKLKENHRLITKLITNVEHSLDVDDNVADSIELLKSIMIDIEQFLKK